MAFQEKVRARVKAYFNPDAFDPLAFRKMMEMTLLGLIIGEVAVYMMLRDSARVGELPSYITDVLIISISCIEFILAPFIGWLGTQRRRSILVMWVVIALVGILPLFGAPKPDVVPDVAYCSNSARFLSESVSARAAVRLAILILAALSCALARVAVTAHTLAYLDEYHPSANLHMNVAMLLLVRVLLLHVGSTLLQGIMVNVPWLQFLILVAKFVYAIVKLHKFPVLPPTVSARLGRDRTQFRSLGRVLRSEVAMLQILAMALLAAAMWGFGSQEAVFSKMKYHVIPGTSTIWEMNAPIRALLIILGVTLAGFLYTAPVMPVFKQRRAVCNSARMALYCVILFVVMTAVLSCYKGPVAGLDDGGYNQPACGRSCGCDRPWTEFAPVCVTEQMTTYFSPCHAGCAAFDTVGEIGVYANCSCAGGGRATAGACGDGTCYVAYGLHSLLFSSSVLASTLAFVWLGSVMLENVDRRDKSVAVGLASGVVSIVAFAGAHGFFTWIAALAFVWLGSVMLENVDRRDKSVAVGLASGVVSIVAFAGAHGFFTWIAASTCAQFRGQRCLFQTSEFVPWVGYSSAALAGASFLVSIASFIVLSRRRRAEKKLKEAENMELSS